MTETTTPESADSVRPPRKSINRWMILSLIASSIVLGTSFYTSIQKADFHRAPADTDPESAEPDRVREIKLRRSRAEQFRDAAMMLDEQLMRTVREKQQRPTQLPDHDDAWDQWQTRVDNAKRQLQLIDESKPEPGSLQWQYKQELLESLEDAPE